MRRRRYWIGFCSPLTRLIMIKKTVRKETYLGLLDRRRLVLFPIIWRRIGELAITFTTIAAGYFGLRLFRKSKSAAISTDVFVKGITTFLVVDLRVLTFDLVSAIRT